MVAENTVKINGVFYKAGDTLPDVTEIKKEKAVTTPVEPPKPIEEEAKEEKKPVKRQYTRRK